MLPGLHFGVSLLGGGVCLSGCNSRLILSDNLWQVIALEGKAGGLLIANYSGFYVGGAKLAAKRPEAKSVRRLVGSCLWSGALEGSPCAATINGGQKNLCHTGGGIRDG